MARVLLPYPPQDREQLFWAVQALLGVVIPRTKVCPDHCAPFDAFADAYFRECTLPGYEGPISRAIWMASRGLAGKSYTVSTLGLFYAYVIGADITILGGSLAQSNNVHEYMVRAMDFEGIPGTMTVDQTATKTKLTNNGRIRPLPASQRNVRGPHPSILLCVAGSTMVDTPDGQVRIDEVKEGETVKAWSITHGKPEWNTVLRVLDQGEKATMVVELSNGAELTCTPDHQVKTWRRGWVEAGDLRLDDLLLTDKFLSLMTIAGFRHGPVTRCWDITTSAGTFFADGVLVHNCDEVDEMELDIYDAALGQPMPQKNYLDEMVDTFTVVSSTWQNPDGTFTEILRRAEENHQPVYKWCIAAGAQITTGRGLVPIEQVRSRDHVLTRVGWRAVQHVAFMGFKQTLSLRTVGGHTLTCTPDHLVSTSSGWLPAGALRPGDRLNIVDALPAVPSPVGALVGVRGVIGVPGGAGLPGELPSNDLPALSVDALGDDFQVLGEAAGVHLADMINGEPGRDVDTSQSHGQSVGQLLAPRIGGAAHLPVSGGIATPLPYPATLVVDHDTFPDVVEVHVESVVAGAIEPVYDIGVEGEHEFIANGIVVHNCYKESANPVDGWLTQKTIQEKKDSVSAEMFRVEYDLGEPTIGNRAFDAEAIEATFSAKFKPDDAIGQGKGYIEHKVMKDFEEYRFARRVNAGQYVAGADWAKEQDKTVIWVARIDGPQRELVYFLRVNRRPYPLMIGYLNKAISYYRVPLRGVWHDSTGLGNVVNDYLDIRAKPFPMTGDKRAILLSDYVNAVEKGAWKIPRIPSTWLEHKYCVGIGSLVWTVRGDIPIEQVQVGDMAMTRSGFRRVTAVMDNGQRPVGRLRTRDGKEVLLTWDHSVATGRGWVRVDSLQVGDVTYVGLADAAVSASRGVESGVLAGVRVPVGALCGGSMDVGDAVAAQDVHGLGDRLQVGRIATRPADATSLDDVVDNEAIRDRADEQLVGQAVGDRLGPIDPDTSASVAELIDVLVPDPTVAGDRDPIENVALVEDDLLAMSRAVRAANGGGLLGGFSAIGTDHVADTTPAGIVRVFDLTVEGEHEFFANGICVHNCSTGDLYEHSSKYHLPDTVCAAALAEYAAKRFTGSAAPVVVSRTAAPSKLEKEFIEDEQPHKHELAVDPAGNFDLTV